MTPAAAERRIRMTNQTTASLTWLDPRYEWTATSSFAACVVGLVVVAVAWAFRSSVVPTDPWHYIQSALAFPDATWVPLGYTRYGMILPLIPLGAIFGNSEVVYYVWPLIGAGLLAGSLYLLAFRFFGRIAGLLAVLLGLVSPITFVNLSRGYPDVLSTGVFGLTMVLALVARDRVLAAGLDRGSQVPITLLVFIGFLVGWGFETRETTILAWPIIGIVLMFRVPSLKLRLPRLATFVAIGILIWVIGDLVIGQLGYHDALIRVHAFTHQDLAATTNAGDLAAKNELVGRDRLFYLSAVPHLLLSSGHGGRWSLIIGAAALLGLLCSRTRFASVVFLDTFLGFIGITGMFFPHHPSGRIDIERYWISFLPWAGLAAAGIVAQLAGLVAPKLRWITPEGVRIHRRAVMFALMLVTLIGPSISLSVDVASQESMPINGGDQLARLSDWLATSGPASSRIYTDWYTMRLLPIYQRPSFGGPERWHAELRSLTGRHAVPAPGDLVAINSLTNLSCSFCHRVISQWNDSKGPVPRNWSKIWATTNGNLVLYRVH